MSKKIKVLFVRPTLGQGGADRVTAKVLARLDRSKFELHLGLLGREGEWLKQIPDDVQLHAIGGQRVRYMLRPLSRLVQELKPDVVFSTSSGTNMAAVLAARNSGCRAVISERSIVLNGGLSAAKVAQWGLKALVYRMSDVVTAVSRGVADDMARKLLLRKERIHVLLNPVVDEEIGPLAQQPVDHEWFAKGNQTILSVGRLQPVKGHLVLVEAFSRVRKELSDARLVIIGEGPERSAIEDRIGSLGLSDNVKLLGFQSNPMPYFRNAAVFALTSRNEGLPNVLIEAMACGLPVVATDCPPGMKEFVTDGVNGFLVPVDDRRLISERIIQVLKDNRLAARFSENGQKSSAEYTTKSVIARYEIAIELSLQ